MYILCLSIFQLNNLENEQFFSVLLRYNWDMILYTFKIYNNDLIWYMFILQSDYHSKFCLRPAPHIVTDFSLLMRAFKIYSLRGAWVTRLFRRSTLDFSSGHDLAVRKFKPCIGLCTYNVESLHGILSFTLLLPTPFSLSLSQNKQKKKNLLS